jgi:plasmid stabilization system protein ParE
MAKVIWTLQAEKNLSEIIHYWINKGKKDYAAEVLENIKKRISFVSKNIYIGQRTDDNKTRIIRKEDFSIFYRVTTQTVYIVLLTNNVTEL